MNQMEQNKLQRRTERSSPYYAEFSKLREKIYATPAYNWSIDAMCKEMILSRGYFQKLYTRCFGISFTQDVINSRIAHAKKLLAQTDQSIAVIAEKSGYDNYVHFMHQFKKIVGITPTDYRRKKNAKHNEKQSGRNYPPDYFFLRQHCTKIAECCLSFTLQAVCAAEPDQMRSLHHLRSNPPVLPGLPPELTDGSGAFAAALHRKWTRCRLRLHPPGWT